MSSQYAYRSLFDNMLEAFVCGQMHFGGRDRPCDFTVLDNPAFEKITELVNLVGRQLAEVPPGIREAEPHLFEIYARAVPTGPPARFDNVAPALGKWFLAAVYCLKPDHFGVVFDEITDRKAAEQAVREREALFRDLIEAAPDAIVIIDSGGIIQMVNAETERVLGYPCTELVGTSVEGLLPERFRDRLAELVADFVGSPRTRPMGSGIELLARRRDGSEFPIEVALSSAAAVNSELITATIRDVTVAKHAEAIRTQNRELERENQRVREASRLKSEFLAHMSHELRTPLNAIIGFGEILCEGQVDPSSPQGREFLGDILASGRHLLQLINDVLDVSKVEAGRMVFRPKPVDLHTITTQVCSIGRVGTVGLRLDIDIGIDIDIQPGLEATLDPDRFKQVLYNYLSNALKVTRAPGRVSVRVIADGTDCLRLEVQDAGPGIAPADLARLFTEFVQLDSQALQHPAGTGSGLGLALTKRLVEAQGGSVGVTSVLGTGSTFFAVLPRHPAGGSPGEILELHTFGRGGGDAPRQG